MSADAEGADGSLSCPRCGRAYPAEERFCAVCGMPLVPAGGGEQEPTTDAHGRWRKVRPQYAQGRLVRVAVGRNLAEGELIQGVLLEQGIPSMLRRTGGFDVPDFLAAGPRDVLVPESGAQTARELLGEPDPATAAAGVQEGVGEEDPDAAAAPAHGPAFRLVAGLFVLVLASGALVGVSALLWLLIR